MNSTGDSKWNWPPIRRWAARKGVILLLFAYQKNRAADLTPSQTAQLARLAKEEFRDE